MRDITTILFRRYVFFLDKFPPEDYHRKEVAE